MSPKLLNILLVLIPVILYYGVFDPLYTGKPGLIWTPEFSIGGLQAANVQYTNTSNLLSEVQRGIKKINEEYKAVEATTTKKMEKMLPDSIDPIKLKDEVLAIADSAGVSITGVTVKTDERFVVPGTGSYIVSFSFKARYPALKLLLEAYERNTRFYTVDMFTINRQEAKGLSESELKNLDAEALMGTIQYKVYYLK